MAVPAQSQSRLTNIPLFFDLKFAFDVASIPHMLSAKAGVSGHSWLLMDDILASDTQSILFAGFMSQSFQLAAGTAQGRRFSSFIFKALVKDLADIVAERLPGKVHADLPLFAADLLLEAHHAQPADCIDSFALPTSQFSSAVRVLQNATRGERSGGPHSRASLKQLLPSLPHAADRFALLEALGERGFSCIQYSDDCTVPCHSLGAVTRILSPQLDSACNSYARKVKGAFNLARGKTGCMAEGFELSLNRTQASWGCGLLGAQRQARARFSLITTQLGWQRLGSKIIEAAIVALARLRCLPASYPGAIMLRAALLSGTGS